jgi:hypothetical protein
MMDSEAWDISYLRAAVMVLAAVGSQEPKRIGRPSLASETFLGQGGHDNSLKRLISDKRIKGNQRVFLGKIWLDLGWL